MPKVIYVPPPIPKEAIPAGGAVATIKSVRVARNLWTPIGTAKMALGITVDLLNGEYSQLFSLDRETLTGSVGRILAKAGIENVPDNADEEFFKPLIGMKVRVVTKGGKLYWYP
jgi:hypothetical protein